MAAAGEKYIASSEQLARESNALAKRFNPRLYSRIEDIDGLLLRRDISVEEKKGILVRKLHESVTKAFSIDKKKFGKKNFDSLRKRIHGIRKIVLKLRSINYYLETAFLRDLKSAKIRISYGALPPRQQRNLGASELELLEFTAYRLIEKAVVLDKRLLKEYSRREKKIAKTGRVEANDLGSILRKESELLEHLEAKLPPQKAATIGMAKEPIFTHWVARVFALLSYIEHVYGREKVVFARLKKNKSAKSRISKKISHLLAEKSKLLKIMEEKTASMKTGINGDLKLELSNFTTITGL